MRKAGVRKTILTMPDGSNSPRSESCGKFMKQKEKKRRERLDTAVTSRSTAIEIEKKRRSGASELIAKKAARSSGLTCKRLLQACRFSFVIAL
jgi:hypothetical protein